MPAPTFDDIQKVFNAWVATAVFAAQNGDTATLSTLINIYTTQIAPDESNIEQANAAIAALPQPPAPAPAS